MQSSGTLLLSLLSQDEAFQVVLFFCRSVLFLYFVRLSSFHCSAPYRWMVTAGTLPNVKQLFVVIYFTGVLFSVPHKCRNLYSFSLKPNFYHTLHEYKRTYKTNCSLWSRISIIPCMNTKGLINRTARSVAFLIAICCTIPIMRCVNYYASKYVSRDSSVAIVTRLRARRSTSRASIPGRARDLSEALR